MQATIKVIGHDGNESQTYPRRAKQLVLKDKAVWMGDSTIVLKKEPLMDTTPNLIITDDSTATTVEAVYVNKVDTDALKAEPSITADSNSPTDQVLLYMAKQNVAYKQNIWINVALIVPAFFAALIFAQWTLQFDFVFGMYMAWLFYTLYRFVVHIKLPWLKKIMANNRKIDPIQQEFEKLKQAQEQ